MITSCPFCKSNDVEVQDGSFVCWVACMKCDANGPPTESIDESIKLWNRAEETVEHEPASWDSLILMAEALGLVNVDP